jgi:LysM repeat protein
MRRARLYDRRGMVRRSRARYLAPIALAAVIAGTYVIVHASLTHKHTSSQARAPRPSRARRKFEKVKFYVVRPGDSLTSIAAKTGVSVTTLEALNPKVDPNSLQAAQRLRLRR